MKHNIDNCFIDSVIKKNLFKSSLKKIDFIIDEIKKSKDPLLLSFLNQFYSYHLKQSSNAVMSSLIQKAQSAANYVKSFTEILVSLMILILRFK